jgi:predicted transcriptional regulator of viral defense system
MASSKFQTAKPQIRKFLNDLSPHVFKMSDISFILEENREEWDLPKSMNGSTFTKKLVESNLIREHKFAFPVRSERRYAKPHVPMLEVLQTIKANSYYTHASAMQVHGLLEARMHDIYINFEQPAHDRGSLPEQKRIDAAFKAKPRRTKNVIEGDNGDITMLNGMQTGLLGIEEKYAGSLDIEPATVRVTNLERTLIDITVRPHYAGNVETVLRAYELARDRTNVTQLVRYLKKLDYVYPYHQAVGWYLDKAGYSATQLKTLRSRPKQRRFYLAHHMSAVVFDEVWQIYVPEQLERIA